MTRRRSRGRPPEAQAESPPAWQRIDLHLHTPGSGDYQEPRAGYLDLLQRAEARGLDIIAFTDHNSVAGYAAMRREIERLEFLEASARLLPEETRRLHEYRRLHERILILPGFEFTATFGFHILGIFSPETTVRKLEHLLLALNIPEEKLDKGASEVGATTDVLRAYEIIAGAGGLVIGAHVNSTNGIAMIGLGFGGQTKIAYTQDPNLHALEVTDLESVSRRATARFFNSSKPEYPRRMHCIQGSDAHRVTRDPLRPEKNLGIGDRCTEVLLPEVSFEALKALFASTDFSRTRPARAPEEHPFDPLTGAREDGATIVQAFQDMPGSPPVRVRAILKDVVAFANTNGGAIYVGASADPREPIRGVDGAAELAELIRLEAERQIVPPLVPDVETLTSEDKTVLVVTVQKGTETPYALEPGYIYVRQEGETVLALRDEVVQLVRAALAPQTIGPDLASTLPPRPATIRRDRVEESDDQPGQPAPLHGVVPPPPYGSAPRDPQQIAVQQAAAQQVAVQQATAAERERQQERTPVPRTGVEVIASTERNGLVYHTVRDLRNRRVVRNVTRESARRLWRYALLQVEQHIIEPAEIRWDEPDGRFGFWKGFRQPEGMRRYNLIYREPAGQRGQGEGGERLRVFFGVTEEGIDERWRAVLPSDSELPILQYDEDLHLTTPATPPQEPPAPEAPSVEPEILPGQEAPPDPGVEAIPAPTFPAPTIVRSGEATPEPWSTEIAAPLSLDPIIWPSAVRAPGPEAGPSPGVEMAPTTDAEPEVAAPAPRRRTRSRGGRGGGKTAAPAGEAADVAADELVPPAPAADIASGAEPITALPIGPVAAAPPAIEESPTPEDTATESGQEPTAAPKRRRAPRRAKTAAEPVEVAPQETATTPAPAPPGVVAAESPTAPEPSESVAPPAPARRRRSPRKSIPASDPPAEEAK